MSDICSPPIKKWNDFYSTVLSYAILAPLYLIITLILLFPIYCIAGGIYSALFYDHWLAGGALILAGFGVMPGAFGALAELKKTIFG